MFADIGSNDNLKTEDLNDINPLCILIGPEGDFSPKERELLENSAALRYLETF